MNNLRQYTGAETALLLPQIAEVFRAAFALPPYQHPSSHTEKFVADWPNRARRPGFLFFGVHNGSEADSPLIGFTYGWPSRRGDHWHNEFAKTLGDQAAYWLEDCFELVDLAVAPQAQGHGLGRRLLHELFHYVSARTAILLTHDSETPAHALYTSEGWQTLAIYTMNAETGATKRFRLMGRKL